MSMAILFERNGDWPDTDQDYLGVSDEEDNSCFFCDSDTGCICDSVYDFAQEQELIDEYEALND
jgi:hypothetical protein